MLLVILKVFYLPLLHKLCYFCCIQNVCNLIDSPKTPFVAIFTPILPKHLLWPYLHTSIKGMYPMFEYAYDPHWHSKQDGSIRVAVIGLEL